LSGDFFEIQFDTVLVFVVMVDIDVYMCMDIEIFNRYKKVVLDSDAQIVGVYMMFNSSSPS